MAVPKIKELLFGPNDGYCASRPKVAQSHKRVLQRSLEYAVGNVSRIDEIFRKLVSREVLTTVEVDRIRVTPVLEDQLDGLLKLIAKKGSQAFGIFKEILRSTGNEHVVNRFNAEEDNIKNSQRTGQESESRGTKQLQKKKKGKMFSVYAASDDEDNISDDESNYNFDESRTADIHSLTQYFLFLEWFFKYLDYQPDRTFTANRFEKEATTPSGNPKPNMVNIFGKYKGKQRFRVSRAIYLDKIGFYGPENDDVASYEVEVKITFWPDTSQIIGYKKEIIEVRKSDIDRDRDGQQNWESDQPQNLLIRPKMYITPRKALPLPIRPHVWHLITFTIKGKSIMTMQKPENQKTLVDVHYPPESKESVKADLLIANSGNVTRDSGSGSGSNALVASEIPPISNGKVEFEFDTVNCYSTCQIPELVFYKGKYRIPSARFPEKKRRIWSSFANTILKAPMIPKN